MTKKEYKQLCSLKRAIDARFYSIGKFVGYDGMLLISFLSKLVEAFNGHSVSEGSAVHILDSSLSDTARSIYDSHVLPGRSTQVSRLCAPWP